MVWRNGAPACPAPLRLLRVRQARRSFQCLSKQANVTPGLQRLREGQRMFNGKQLGAVAMAEPKAPVVKWVLEEPASAAVCFGLLLRSVHRGFLV